MRPYTKMMLLQENDNENDTERARREYERAREETDRARMEYDRARAERSGTRGVNSDGYSYPIYPSSKGREWTITENRGGGRYSPKNIGYPGVPPIFRDEYGGEENGKPMNKIGFAIPDEVDGYGYGMRYNYPTAHEMPYHEEMTGKHYSSEHGFAMGIDGMEKMDKQTAIEWCKAMENEDGTRGPHWSMDQARQVMEQNKIHCDEVEFFVALNMMYSDYCEVAKKHGCSNAEFYAGMAKAFLDDKDANRNKLSRYYEYIVR